MEKRDKRERVETTLKIDKEIYKELKLICIDLNITPSEYIEKMVQRIVNGYDLLKSGGYTNDR